ncbi:MAG: porphobilinogen synthase [Phycisphaerae bacterium]|nr:porphobilinogen synthase [Phycisphaerae bacterium]
MGSIHTTSNVRMRRLRRTGALRDLVAHHRLSPEHFVAPLFVRSGQDMRRPILSMPGQFQFSPDTAVEEVKELFSRGVRAVILFGVTDSAQKDACGTHAHDPNNAVCTTLRRIRDAGIELVAMTDLCYCEYTNHGHCGPLIGQVPAMEPQRVATAGLGPGAKRPPEQKAGLPGVVPGPAAPRVNAHGPLPTVDNDATIAQMCQQAVLHAQAGADVIAPSGMMDHGVLAVRKALDEAGFSDRCILSYAVKYASGYYGPFRDAAESPPQFGDRRGYQMDFRRGAAEALREALLDVQEGADMVMVKPGMAYLDILQQVAATVDVPCATYQVSGEYAMFKAAAAAGFIDEQALVLETMYAFRRAGAAFVLTYYAGQIAEWLGG